MNVATSVCPYFRFSLRYCMSPGEIHGPRRNYIQSFNLIEAGEGKLHTETGTVALYPGVHIYTPSGKKHTWEASRTNPFIYRIVFFEWNYRDRPGIVYPSDYIADFGRPAIEEYIEPPLPQTVPEYIVLDDTTEWNRLFAPILSNYDVYDKSRFPASMRIQGHFQLFLDYMLNHAMQPKSYMDRRIKKFIQTIEETGSAPAPGTIAQWTEQNGMSRSHFHYLFKLHTGTTPHAYWAEHRIKRTCRDLIETTATITEIADNHQFESVQYYAKLFHKVIGLTPGEFRRRNRIY